MSDSIKAKERVLSDLNSSTERISETTRYIGYGLSLLTFTLYSSESELAGSLLKDYRTLILWSSCFGVATVLSDYLQFLSAYFSSLSTYESHKGSEDSDWKYPEKSFLRKARFGLFYAKQFFAVIGLVLLIIAFVSALTSTR